ncbi:DUF362 domain-containing protein, partial [Chloroflexota bacterium]
WEQYVTSSSRVFVKPNFCFPYYTKGVTTNPELLRCLLNILKSRAGSVVVGESDGGMYTFTAEDAFRGHDMYRICDEAGVELVSLSRLPSRTVKDKILGKTVQVELPEMLLDEIDCFISLPVLKVHVVTDITLSLKNSWGCIGDTKRGLHHNSLGHKLALIAQCLKPKIVVVDGSYALDNHGPMYGEAVNTNMVLMADNTVVADALGARVMGFSPTKIQHIRIAENAGLGPTGLEHVQLNRDWQPLSRQFRINKTIIDWVSMLLFNWDFASKVIMDSPLTPLIYKIAGLLRTSEEKKCESEMKCPGSTNNQ